MPSVGFMATAAHALAQVLLDLGYDVELDICFAAAPGGDTHRVVDLRQVPTLELDVHDRSDDLNDLSYPFGLWYLFHDECVRSSRRSTCERRTAGPRDQSHFCAPDTTSMISRVIAAWRTLFM
jgi:hypothetical protein